MNASKTDMVKAYHGQITDALCNRDIAEMMMTKALNACAAFIDSIRPPWTFVETKKPA